MSKARASTTTTALVFAGFALLAALTGPKALAGPEPSGLPDAAPAFLPAATLQRLEAGEELTHTLWGSRGPELMPRVTLARELAAELEALDITIGVETMRVYDAAPARLDSADARLFLYNVLRSISTMEGLEYYSASRGRMRTLFAASYAIDSPDSRRRIPDPLVDTVPAYNIQYMFQKDLTFGENTYRAEYLSESAGVILKTRNLTQMRYYLLPMVKPGDSLTVLMVLPYGNRILFYGIMAAHTPTLLGIERSREESFYNRLNAMYGWFVNQVDGAVPQG